MISILTPRNLCKNFQLSKNKEENTHPQNRIKYSPSKINKKYKIENGNINPISARNIQWGNLIFSFIITKGHLPKTIYTQFKIGTNVYYT